MAGAVEGKYDYEHRQKRRDNPSQLKLVLDDGRFWQRNEKVPDEIYNDIMMDNNVIGK